MKLVTYSAGGEQRVGAVVGDDNNQVVDLAAADRALARREKRKTHAFFSDMLTLLEAGSKGISAAESPARIVSLWSSPNARPTRTWWWVEQRGI